MIRKAKVEDLPRLAEIGTHFFTEGKIPGKLLIPVFVDTWTKLLASGAGILILQETDGRIDGAIGGVAYPDINDGELVATEMFWFLEPDARGGGLRLLNEFEKDAILRGAKRILMVHLTSLSPEILEKIYCKRGYTPIEVHYLKTL